MENLSSYFYLILLTIGTFFGGGIILYKFYFPQKYTRERFAFYSVWAFFGFFIALIGLLLVRNQMLDLIVAILNKSGSHITEYGRVDFFVTTGFILFCAGVLYFLIRNIHQNWDGTLSTRQVDLAETNRQVSLLEDFQFYRTKRDQIEIYQPKEKSKPEVFSPYEPDTRPWHLKAANLFSLLDQQYHINLEKDWYREEECFISRYGQDENKIGILCLEQRPSDERLRDFFDFVEKRGGNFEKLIVAIEGKGPESKGTKLGKEAHFRFGSELLDKLISFRSYKDFIKDYFETVNLENSDLTIADIYVPLGGYQVKIENNKLNKDTELESVEAYILAWARGERTFQTEHLAVLGEYGQGKTVLMHKIVYEMLNHPDKYRRIPILVELRGLSPRNDNEFSIFGHWANRFKAKAEALWELHRAGKLLLILDGFDEMDLVGDSEMLFHHFAQLWALARVPKAQIIIAGRPNLFADDEQRRMALGIQDARTQLPYAKAIYLDKLRQEQIDQVLRHVKTETHSGILNALQQAPENSSFVEIITRPSTLFQLSTVWDAELAKKQERLNSATVIGSFITKTYDRQQSKGDHMLTSFERSYFMMGIAAGMMLGNGYINQIKHRDLQKMVERLWISYPLKLPPYADAMEGHHALDFLPTRMKENPNALESILKDVRAGGILVQDISGRDVFKFAHKSYLEYLVSAFFSGFTLQNEHERPLLMMVNAIAKTFRFSDVKLKASPDVEHFTSELIAAKIELKDDQGMPLPIDGNEKQYAQKLFKLLILKSYPWSGRIYPKRKIWLSLHQDIPRFLWIGILSLFCWVGYFIFKDQLLARLFISLNTLLCCFWAGILLKYQYKKSSLNFQRAFYLSKFRLYLLSCRQAGGFEIKLPTPLKLIINEVNQTVILQELSVLILAYFVTFAGAFAFAAAFAFAFAEAEVEALAGASAGLLGISAGAKAGALADARIVAFAGAFAGIFLGSFAFAGLAGTNIVRVPATDTEVGTSLAIATGIGPSIGIGLVMTLSVTTCILIMMTPLNNLYQKILENLIVVDREQT